jgi:hypothetical protein
MTRTVHGFTAALLAATLASGCSLIGDARDGTGATEWDPAVSLTGSGQELAASAGLADSAPTYDVDADVEPTTGKVSGTVRAEVPVGGDEVLMRYFAGLPDFEADASVGEVTVDGAPVDASLDRALLRVPLPEGHPDRVRVTIPFSYSLPMSEPGGGLLDALGGLGGPADVGLLSRHRDAVNLGHWFPLWIPAGNSADPDPNGYGDIGNSPAALIRSALTVPAAWQVVDGGVRTGSETSGGKTTVTSEGYGMNDLVVSVVKDYAMRERALGGELDGVVVRAYGPKDAEAELAGVLDETVTSIEVLSDRFADYPWREFDVVSAPLGSGVAGMEWPGATWIEPSLFTGGVPGLAGLEDVLGGVGGLEGLDDLLGGLGGDLGGLVGGEAGRMIETMRAWTIAHEVGHEWWHVIVGNDSVLAPAVDEPLAQYSACLVIRELEPGSPRRLDELCDTHIESGYEQMRLLGDPDAPAARATDEFASATQYAGVVYGKAAAFYRTLEERFGREEVTAALGAVTEQHAFGMLSLDDLRAALAAELDDPAFDRLWRRWMQGTHGDLDLDVDPGQGAGGLGGLGGLGGGEAGDLDQLLEQLLGEGGSPQGLEDLLGSVTEAEPNT